MKFLKNFNEKFDEDFKKYTSNSNGIIRDKFEDMIDCLQELFDKYEIRYETGDEDDYWTYDFISKPSFRCRFWTIRGFNRQVPAKRTVGVRGQLVSKSDPAIIIKMCDDNDDRFLERLWIDFEKDLKNLITKIENRIGRKIKIITTPIKNDIYVGNPDGPFGWGDTHKKVCRAFAIIHFSNIKYNESNH